MQRGAASGQGLAIQKQHGISSHPNLAIQMHKPGDRTQQIRAGPKSRKTLEGDSNKSEPGQNHEKPQQTTPANQSQARIIQKQNDQPQQISAGLESLETQADNPSKLEPSQNHQTPKRTTPVKQRQTRIIKNQSGRPQQISASPTT